MNHLTTIHRTMSSREIAEMTNKQHKDVLKAIRSMETSWEKVAGRKFALSEYEDSTGRKLPLYELTKKEGLYIATKFNDEARAKVIIRWEELETQSQFQIPQSMSEALMLAAKQAEQLENQQKQLEEQKPKVLFAESVSQAYNSILIRELAIILAQNGAEIGEKRLFDYLRSNGYLVRRDGKDRNTPTQRSIEMGLFTVAERTFNNSQGSFIAKTTYVTGKGQQYFVNKFLSNQLVN